MTAPPTRDPVRTGPRPHVPRHFGLLTLTLACLAAARPAHADPPGGATHRLGGGLGYVHHGVLDQAATSIAYDGHLARVALLYQGESARLRWTVGATGTLGHLEATAHPGRQIRFETQHPDGELETVTVPVRAPLRAGEALLRLERAVSVGRTVVLWGGDARYALTYTEGFVAPGLMQSVELRPSLGVRLPLPPEHRVELSVRALLVAWATRLPYDQAVSLPGQTPYQGWVERGSSWRSLGSRQTLSWEASYQRDFGAHGTVRVSAGVDWLHDERPRPLRVVDAHAEVTLLGRMGGAQ